MFKKLSDKVKTFVSNETVKETAVAMLEGVAVGAAYTAGFIAAALIVKYAGKALLPESVTEGVKFFNE